MKPSPRHALSIVIALSGLAALTGCAMFRPRPTAAEITQCGKIVIRDRASRRHLDVVSQTVKRPSHRHLVVGVTWELEGDEPYVAQVRVSFYDEQDLLEVGSYEWNGHTFMRGRQYLEWTSATPDAVRYIIEVRGAN